MPVSIKQNSSGGYQVRTPNMVHAKNTTLANAKHQRNLLNAVEHSDWRPTGQSSGKTNGALTKPRFSR